MTDLSAAGQCTFGTFTGRAQTSQGTLVVRDVFLVFALELLHKVVHHAAVKVLASKMSVARCRLHLEDSILNGQDGNIECAAAEVKDEDVAFCANLLVEAVCDSGSRRLIDDTQNVQTRNRSGILCCLTLGVIEVSRNCHHRIRNRLQQMRYIY